MAGNDFIWRFTPSRTDPQLLEEIFVQREALLADIVERVRESALSGNKHQILLIGPRGIGKTHLIALLYHRITQDATLSDKVRIAWLLEDETITSFVQLLKRIYELLAEEYAGEFPRDWLEDLLDQPPAKILKALETTLVNKFRGKTLLLFVENLDLVFEGLGDAGQKQWRAFLQTHPFTSIVATSQRLFKSIKSREQPFFGFFNTIPLKPLPAPDAVDLLGRIARQSELSDLVEFLTTPEGRSRVRALHHLAGGNHRIYIVLSGFITRESLDELTGPFEKMADELTPYYQERMRWLSPQQRQIVEYLCAREEPCTPKEIARHLLTAENSISSQLKKLLELGYLLRNPRGRESLYELAEPLMRLASEVKDKRRKPLRLLVSFLRIWYRPDVLSELLAKAGTPSLRALLEAAISQARSSPDPRLKLLEAEIERAKEENRLKDLLQVLEERAHTRGSAKDWFELAYYHAEIKNLESAVACYDKALEIDPRNASVWIFKGLSLKNLSRHQSAIDCYNKALEINPQNAYAWSFKGEALDNLSQYESAIDCYDKALKIDPQSEFVLTLKRSSLIHLGRYEHAIECSDKALEINLRDAPAWVFKGFSLGNLRQHESAIECFDKALEIDPRNEFAWSSKGFLFANLGRYESAIACCDKALEIDPRNEFALYNKGSSLANLGRHESAVACYDKALEINPRNASAWRKKGLALGRLGRDEVARKCHEKALRLSSKDPNWRFVRCELLFALQRWDAGFTTLKEDFERWPRNTEHDVKDILDLMMRLSDGREDLRRHLATLIEIYREAGVLAHLGDGLVRSLRRIDAGRVGAKTLEDWRDAWLELGADHAELEIPLRIFRVGIEYLIRGDEKVLLDLVILERTILRQALGLDAEDGVE
jgi:tetratricopeptide (TPR) repeat protein